MTSNRDFKQLVRQRMAATGERYTTARAHLLAAGERPPVGPGPHPPPPGVEHLGGQQPDVSPARNLLADAGVRLPDGSVPSEALVFGLAGGIGFLCGVFEYRTPDGAEPTMTIVPRNSSMPDPFLAPLFARAGVAVDVAETGGARTAARQLDDHLAGGRPVLLSVGEGLLPYLGLPASEASMSPRVVRAVGLAGDGPGADVLLDDRAPVPLAVPRDALDSARGVHRKARHRLVAVAANEPGAVVGLGAGSGAGAGAVGPVGPVGAGRAQGGEHDWAAAVTEAVRAGAAGYDTPPAPSFAANVGTRGLRTWQSRLVASGQAKGWPRVFPEGRRAAIALTRLHDCISHDYTAPAASRPLYADFLVEAAALAGHEDEWLPAAEELRGAGRLWSRVAEVAADVDEGTRRHAELSGERVALLDAGGDPAAARAAVTEQQELVAGSRIDAATAVAAYAEIAELVAEIADREERVVARLAAA